MEESVNNMFWDTHVHTTFSGDGTASPEEMIRAAQKKGLAGICFTDHVDWDFANDMDIYLLDVEGYTNTCQELKHAVNFPVCMGIEAGFQPHLSGRLDEMLKKYLFDFVILSSHMVHGFDPADPVYYRGRTEDEAYLEYFESILENVKMFDNFDVYGHLDYVVRYGPDRNTYYSYEKFQEVINEILRQLISKGKGIEINTSGYRYGLGQPHPTKNILVRYRELGGEIVTIGSDAHAPEHIAYEFARTHKLLKSVGFMYYTVFKEREPEFIRLPD